MRIKEVRISDHERFVICFNPEAADRDAHMRAQMVAQLEDLIGGSDALSAVKRGELRGKISARPGLNRYLRVTPGGLLRTGKAAIKTEENLDGKYLLRSSDPHLSAEDIALGYKQLLEVERGWRDMKQIIDLRPVYHRLEERIRAHVILCWLALLLIRIIETTAGDTWNNIRRHLDRLHLGTFTGPAGTFRQRTELTKPQRDLLAELWVWDRIGPVCGAARHRGLHSWLSITLAENDLIGNISSKNCMSRRTSRHALRIPRAQSAAHSMYHIGRRGLLMSRGAMAD